MRWLPLVIRRRTKSAPKSKSDASGESYSDHFDSLESQIAKLKRNQERRIDRKNKKIAKEGGELLVAAPNVKSETTRKCGNCGDVGHMSEPTLFPDIFVSDLL